MRPTFNAQAQPDRRTLKLCANFRRNRKGSELNFKRWKKVMMHHEMTKHSVAAKIQFFMAMFRSQGYKWSSIVKSISDVQHCLRHFIQPRERLRFVEARKFALRKSLSEAVTKAPQWTLKELKALRDSMPTGLRSLVDLMMTVPIRPSCLKYLRYSGVSIRGEMIKITIPGGKIIASQQDVMPRTFKVSEFLPSTIAYLTRGPADDKIFDITTSELNTALQNYSPSRHITSYSVRNMAVNSRIDLSRDKDGVPDYERVKLSTGHRHTKSISGSYEYH